MDTTTSTASTPNSDGNQNGLLQTLMQALQGGGQSGQQPTVTPQASSNPQGTIKNLYGVNITPQQKQAYANMAQNSIAKIGSYAPQYAMQSNLPGAMNSSQTPPQWAQYQ